MPGNIDRLDELAERGVIGFKAFMSNSGIDDFQAVDDLTLYEGMARAAKLGSHRGRPRRKRRHHERAGSSRPGRGPYQRARLSRLSPHHRRTGCHRTRYPLRSRDGLPIAYRACQHGRGVNLVTEARARGVDVTCETCPHYLTLTEEDVMRLGAVAKCAPPIRSQQEQDALWQHIFDGTLPMVVSDHSPAPADMKQDANFFRIWGGISGCQSLLQLLLTDGYEQRQMPLPLITSLTAANIAQRFGLLPRKGQLAPGADADLAIVDLGQQETLEAESLFYRHRHSPYVGKTLRGRIVRTIVRGRTVFRDGQIVSRPIGQLLKPNMQGANVR